MKATIMNSFLRSPRRLVVLAAAAAAFLLPSAARAFPPAPPHVIYGLVRDEYGQPITLTNAQIIFTVEGTNGVQVTGSIIPDLEPGINYRLSIPMDSGTKPDAYKATALKATVPFRIRVKIGTTTYLPIQMVANFANLGKPAGNTRLDLTIGEDADGDGLPDAWQRLLLAMLGPGARTGPNDDADGDGISNLHEYLAGTYAFDPESRFQVKILRNPGGGPPLLDFQVANARTYTIYASTNMQTWTPMNFKIPAGGPTDTNLPNYRSTDIRNLQLEPKLPSGTPLDGYFFKVLVQ